MISIQSRHLQRRIIQRSTTANPSCILLKRLNTTEATEKVEIKSPKDDALAKADNWLASPEEGGRYEHGPFDPSASPFLFGRDYPFPTNPLFRPPKPLTDQTRSDLYRLYTSDPAAWTPRRLAEHFGISIARTDAILRLKSLESQFFKDKKPLQFQLTKGMEKLLRAQGRVPGKSALRYEPLRSSYGTSMTPFFKFVDETETFTPEVCFSLSDHSGRCHIASERSLVQY